MKRLALLLLCSGCLTTQAVTQASWDHHCDPDEIRVLVARPEPFALASRR
jgi:hypothetical protein